MLPAMSAPLPADASPPNFDPAAAYPEVDAVRRALRGGDWPAVQQIFAGQGSDGRDVLTRAAGEVREAEGFLRSMAQRDLTDTLAGTLWASWLVEAGWKIRTGYRAQHVSREQFAAFHDHLRRAEQVLIDVTAREPGTAEAWTLRMMTARGLELGQAEARRRYDQLSRHVPHHLPAQAQLLQQLCPKWSGTFEKMHSFARDCMLAAPEGAPNAMLVAQGHLEHWLDLPAGDDERYLRDPPVWQEIQEAAQRSVRHPAFRRVPGWVWAENTFAVAFSLAGDHTSAAASFAAIGHLASEFPWAYLDDPAAAFTRYRDKALAKGTAK